MGGDEFIHKILTLAPEGVALGAVLWIVVYFTKFIKESERERGVEIAKIVEVLSKTADSAMRVQRLTSRWYRENKGVVPKMAEDITHIREKIDGQR